MSAQLYARLRVHHVFGANTDVGKTIFTTGLSIAADALPLPTAASASAPAPGPGPGKGEQAFYCKPIQTGPAASWDDAHVLRYAPRTHASRLFTLPIALSPHVAAQAHLRGTASVPTDDELVRAVQAWLRTTAQAAASLPCGGGQAIVEPAGGVHSPTPAGRSLASALRALRAPAILVGDSRLGGISATRSAYDSLLLLGYDVDTILLFPSPGETGTARYLRNLFQDPDGPYGARGTRVFSLGGPNGGAGGAADHWGPPPLRAADEFPAMQKFYRGLVHGRSDLPLGAEQDNGGLVRVIAHLRQRHEERIRELSSMADATRKSCWWPFTQHELVKKDQDVMVIDSAYGDTFDVLSHKEVDSNSAAAPTPKSATAASSSPVHHHHHQESTSSSRTAQPQAQAVPAAPLLQPVFDGSASWWTQTLGHADERLTYAAAEALGRYGHILFPTASNKPSLELAQRLLGLPRPKAGISSHPASHMDAPHPDPRALNPRSSNGDTPPASNIAPDVPSPTAVGAGWASRVFFSDDGSTGMEVALKMALASSRVRYEALVSPRATTKEGVGAVAPGPAHVSAEAARDGPSRLADQGDGPGLPVWEILGLKGSYHGDTIGAMDACEPGPYSEMVDWYRPRGLWLAPPTLQGTPDGIRIRLPAEMRAHLPDQPLAKEPDASALADVHAHISAMSTTMTQRYDVGARLGREASLVRLYKRYIVRAVEEYGERHAHTGHRLGALVLEPLVLGAGGMQFVDPLFQRVLVDTVRSHAGLFDPSGLTDAHTGPGNVTADADAAAGRDAAGPAGAARAAGAEGRREWAGLPVVFDEVFAGLFRLGWGTCSTALGVQPDVAVYAKMLTGGAVPLAVTLASESIFRTFARSDRKVDALLHGHSYTAYPAACAVANRTLGILDRAVDPIRAEHLAGWGSRTTSGPDGEPGERELCRPAGAANAAWSLWSPDAVSKLVRTPGVDSALALGCVLAIELVVGDGGAGGYSSQAAAGVLAQLRHGASGDGLAIHARPLGNVLYLMASLNSKAETLRSVEGQLQQALAAK